MDKNDRQAKPNDKPTEPRPPAWLTKEEVAARLGKKDPRSSIGKLVMRGYLHPIMRNGTYLYALTEVEALARPGRRPKPWLADPLKKRRAAPPAGAKRPEGEQAAHVFRLLDRGLSLRQIVVAAHVPPHRVRALFREWQRSLEDGAPPEAHTLGDGADLDELALAAHDLFVGKA